jgi:hypothetical protein
MPVMMCTGMERVRQLQACVAVERHENLESLLVRHFEQHLREARLILDDEHYPIARLDLVAVVLEPFRPRQTIVVEGRRLHRGRRHVLSRLVVPLMRDGLRVAPRWRLGPLNASRCSCALVTAT